MDAVTYLEVVDRRGQVQQRVRLDASPFRIGRAYSNDLILDDRAVSPEHLIVYRDASGAWIVEDAGSLNGVYTTTPERRIERGVWDGSVELRVGRSILRLRDRHHVVAATVRERPHGFVRWAGGHWSSAALAAALVFAVLAWSDWASTFHPRSWSELAAAASMTLGGMAAWAGAWALVGRLLHHHARFAAHWMIISAAIVANTATEWATEWLRFVWAPIGGVLALAFAVSIAVAALALFAHLGVLGSLRGPRRVLAAVAVAGLGIGVQQLDEYSALPDFVAVLPYWSRLEPVDPLTGARADATRPGVRPGTGGTGGGPVRDG